MTNQARKVKVTITAEDSVGRTESISLMLKESIAKRLENAAKREQNYDDWSLRLELNEMEDDTKQRMSMPVYNPGHLSPSQLRRLYDFDSLIYHKFYNYSLSINVKW